jgi:hypothetical protein
MRAIVDLVDSITGVWTRTISILVIGGIAVVAIITFGIGFAAPSVADKVGDRAERISAKAIEAARQEARAQSMAQEGWGYSDANTDAATESGSFEADAASYDSSEYSSDDWGSASE